jgi:hypothetical protein
MHMHNAIYKNLANLTGKKLILGFLHVFAQKMRFVFQQKFIIIHLSTRINVEMVATQIFSTCANHNNYDYN